MADVDNNSNIAKIIGRNIKQVRSLEGISQEKLAELISKSSHFISLLERGESGLSVATVIDICRVLNTDPNTILAGAFDNSSIHTDSFLNKSLETFSDRDRELVSYIVDYVLGSKS